MEGEMSVATGTSAPERIFLVRAMGQSATELDVFIKGGVVAVGWSEVPFVEFAEPDLLVERVGDTYYTDGLTTPSVRGKKLNEVRRFSTLREGDGVIVPFPGSIALGIATGVSRYASDLKHLDMANQHGVKFLHSADGELNRIPRGNLSEALQRRLRVRGTTIADLAAFAEEIRPMFSGEATGWSDRYRHSESLRREQLAKKLLANIRSGNTNLRTGGRGLEDLVRDMLTADGYRARVLGTRTFGGDSDADVIADRSDIFGEQKMLVQVKHHIGETGQWAANQLLGIRELDQYKDYQLAVVTTADPSEELATACEQFDITLIGGTELVEWVLSTLPRLHSSYLSTLGISQVPDVLS
jgi:predicted Mrr-cat superfamily restriction endonuclease